MSFNQTLTDELNLLAVATRNQEAYVSTMGLTAEHFSSPDSKAIFNALERVHRQGFQPDLVIISSILNEQGRQDTVKKFAQFYTEAPASWNAPYLINKLQRKYRERKIISSAGQIVEGIQNNSLPADQVEEILRDLLTSFDVAESAYVEYRKYCDDELENLFPRESYIKTGLKELDDKLHGLFSTQLICIAARPGLGKTSLALQIALNIPGSLMFSLEMNRRELYARCLSQKAKVESWKIETQKMSEAEYDSVRRQHEYFKTSMDMIVVDKMSSIQQIISTAETFVAKGKCKLLVLDYLQLTTGGQGENQNLRIAYISRQLKEFAQRNGVPVIVLSQLNRDVEKSNRKPMLSDLRDSGAIEQDCDRIIFIHKTDDDYDFIVAKNRKGPTGEVRTRFHKQFTYFGAEFDYDNPEYFQD